MPTLNLSPLSKLPNVELLALKEISPFVTSIVAPPLNEILTPAPKVAMPLKLLPIFTSEPMPLVNLKYFPL